MGIIQQKQCLSAYAIIFSEGRAKRLGPNLKAVLCIGLPVPLILWPLVGLIGSILVGLGYGLFTPLVATFEAIGEEHENKFVDCILVCIKSINL